MYRNETGSRSIKKNGPTLLDWLWVSIIMLLMISIFLYAKYWYWCVIFLIGCVFTGLALLRHPCFVKYKELFLIFLTFCAGNLIRDLAYYILPKWSTVVSYSAFIFLPIYLIVMIDQEKKINVAIRMGNMNKKYLLLLLASVLFFIFAIVISKNFLDILSSNNLFLIILTGMIFALTNSFFEESVFRGFLQNVFSDSAKSDKIGLICQAIVFAFFHFSKEAIPSGWTGVFLTFLFALFVGYSVIKTRGIFFACIIHFIADLGVFYIYCFKAT